MCSHLGVWFKLYNLQDLYIIAPPIKLLPLCFISFPNWQPSPSNLALAEAVPNVFACPCPNGSAFGDIVGWRISCQPRKKTKTVLFLNKRGQKMGLIISTKNYIQRKTLMDDSWICCILAVISLPLFCLVHVHRDWGWRRCRLGILATSHECLLRTGNRRHWMWPIQASFKTGSWQ